MSGKSRLLLAFTVSEDNKYKVDMRVIKKYETALPWLKLVRSAIRSGEGFVSIKGEVEDGFAYIYGWETYGYFLGCVRVPADSLIPA